MRGGRGLYCGAERRTNAGWELDLEAESSQPRVLVVDDDPDTCDILSQLLTYLGYVPVVVSDSTEALPQMLRHRFDLVLLDLVMPGLSGFDVLRAWRSASDDQMMPVVAVSGHNDLRHQAREHGFHAFIEKPVELSKLKPVLSQILPAT